LIIGDIAFSWYDEIPSFLTFLFAPEDTFVKHHQPTASSDGDNAPADHEDDEPQLQQAGFTTTVGSATAMLDSYGYTREFFEEIYASFLPELAEHASNVLAREFRSLDQEASSDEIATRVRNHLASSPDTPSQDLRAFTDLLRTGISTAIENERGPVGFEHSTPTVSPARPGRLPIDIPPRDYVRNKRAGLAHFSLQAMLVRSPHRVPATVLRPQIFFGEEYHEAYPEVIALMYTRLVLDATTDEEIVQLDLHEIVDTAADLTEIHGELAYDLLHKVEIYDQVFRALSLREEDVQDRYARTQIRTRLARLDSLTTARGKGEALEAMMAAVFSLSPQLEVVESRYSTGDEEIDLVVKNNVARPIWHGFNSPLLFAECKNWRIPVGAKEIRDFEGKLKNHALARLGIVVAPGGFTREATTAIQRGSREDHTITLIDRDDLDQLANGAETVISWLERLLLRPI
jgi:hypothetical protein